MYKVPITRHLILFGIQPYGNFTRLKLAFLGSIVEPSDPLSRNLSRFHFSITRSITTPVLPPPPDELPVHRKVTSSIHQASLTIR